MLPIPHVILFLPIYVFTGLVAGFAILQVIEGMTQRPPPQSPVRSMNARPTAQIYYFKPVKTSLRSYPKPGRSQRAVTQL